MDNLNHTTWILTGSPENFSATREHGFKIIGMKERRRKQALQMEVGDRIIFYLTQVGQFAASVIICGEMFEDRTPIWPGKKGNPDPYPWRFPTESELILAEENYLDAELVKDQLEHIQKWPPQHWKLAFQGQLRTINKHDTGALLAAMRAQQVESK